jgi:hypothetical protein
MNILDFPTFLFWDTFVAQNKQNKNNQEKIEILFLVTNENRYKNKTEQDTMNSSTNFAKNVTIPTKEDLDAMKEIQHELNVIEDRMDEMNREAAKSQLTRKTGYRAMVYRGVNWDDIDEDYDLDNYEFDATL